MRASSSTSQARQSALAWPDARRTLHDDRPDSFVLEGRFVLDAWGAGRASRVVDFWQVAAIGSVVEPLQLDEDIEGEVADGVVVVEPLQLDEDIEGEVADGGSVVLVSRLRHGPAGIGPCPVAHGVDDVLVVPDEHIEQRVHVLLQRVHDLDEPRVAEECVERRRRVALVVLFGTRNLAVTRG